MFSADIDEWRCEYSDNDRSLQWRDIRSRDSHHVARTVRQGAPVVAAKVVLRAPRFIVRGYD